MLCTFLDNSSVNLFVGAREGNRDFLEPVRAI